MPVWVQAPVHSPTFKVIRHELRLDSLKVTGGELVMAEANPAGYKELGRAQLLDAPDVWGPLALSDGRLVLRDQKQMKCVYVGEGG